MSILKKIHNLPTLIQLNKSYSINFICCLQQRRIEEKSANLLLIEDSDLQKIAIDLAEFLKEMRKIDTSGAPLPGLHNFYRGAHLSVYDSETKAAISELGKLIDSDK